MRKTFPKNERLTNKRLIRELFAKGSSITFYPIKTLYLPHKNDYACHKVLFAVSRKKFKKAVTRNRLKRQLREAYRLNKYIIEDNLGEKEPFLLAFIYIAKEKYSYQIIESKMISALKALNDLKN